MKKIQDHPPAEQERNTEPAKALAVKKETVRALAVPVPVTPPVPAERAKKPEAPAFKAPDPPKAPPVVKVPVPAEPGAAPVRYTAPKPPKAPPVVKVPVPSEPEPVPRPSAKVKTPKVPEVQKALEPVKAEAKPAEEKPAAAPKPSIKEKAEPVKAEAKPVEEKPAAAPKPSVKEKAEPVKAEAKPAEEKPAAAPKSSVKEKAEPVKAEAKPVENKHTAAPKPSIKAEAEPVKAEAKPVEEKPAAAPKPSVKEKAEPVKAEAKPAEEKPAAALKPSVKAEAEPVKAETKPVEENPAAAPKPSVKAEAEPVEEPAPAEEEQPVQAMEKADTPSESGLPENGMAPGDRKASEKTDKKEAKKSAKKSGKKGEEKKEEAVEEPPRLLTDEEAKKAGILRLDDSQVAVLPAAPWLMQNERLRELLAEGKKKGKLEASELMIVDDMNLESEQMDQLYESLDALNIDYSNSADLLTAPADGEPAAEEIADVEEEELVDPNTLVNSFSVDDPVRMYLKEIGKVPLLSPDEEIRLATRMSAGNDAAEILTAMERLPRDSGPFLFPTREAEALSRLCEQDQTGVLKRLNALAAGGETVEVTAEERARLERIRKEGERAKQKLAEANLRLVVSIAKRYVGRGMLFLDLIQEGNLGLIKAVEKFDYTKGYKFSTYATWWIRQAITRAIADQARTIRIPVHMVETINKVIRVSRQLLQELGHDPSPNEIAEEMNMPVEKVREILKIAQEPVSLETPIGEEEDSHLGDFIPDEGASEPSEAASFTLLKEQLMDVLSTLTPREEKVLKLRFGIEDGRTRTLEEVGKEFNVTRERIRQIEAKALRKLRHPSRSKKLKDFLN